MTPLDSAPVALGATIGRAPRPVPASGTDLLDRSVVSFAVGGVCRQREEAGPADDDASADTETPAGSCEAAAS